MATWGDTIFGGFGKLTKAEADRRRDAEVMLRVSEILHNNKITKRRLVMIIEASDKPTATNRGSRQ